MVPRETQRRVWQHFRPDQCDDKRPSIEWLIAAHEAIAVIAVREGREVPDVTGAILHSAETSIKRSGAIL
jgi:hypothetical protein